MKKVLKVLGIVLILPALLPDFTLSLGTDLSPGQELEHQHCPGPPGAYQNGESLVRSQFVLSDRSDRV